MEETVMFEAMDNQVDAGSAEIGFEAEALGEEQHQDVVAEGQEQGVDSPPQRQDDIGKAFAAESRRLEAKYRRDYERRMEQDPAYIMGTRLINDIMRANGVSMQQAVRIAEDNYYKAIAERENCSPEMARAVFSKQQSPKQDDVYSRAAEIHRELETISMPDGFVFEEAIKDQAFAEMLLVMPTEAAIRVYSAEKKVEQASRDMAEKLRARQSIPQASKPQQPVSPNLDYNNMTDDEFFALETRIKEARARGETVRI